LGIAHFREGDYHKASDYLGRALKVAPEKRNQWGKMYHEARAWASVKDAEQARGAGDWGHAEQLLRRAVQVSSGEPSIRVSLADVLAEQGRYRDAESEYRGVLKQQPDHANALQGLIKTLSQQERTTEAVALIEGLSEAQKRSMAETGIQLRATHYRAKAASLAQRGDDAGAQRALEQALVLDPQDAWVRLDLARLYRHQGADEKAQSLMQGLLLTEPDNPEGLYASALFSAESGNPSEALRQLSTIPTKSQTAAMMALAQRLRVSATIEKALALARRGQAAAARDMLAELERAAGVNPEVVGPVAQAWVEVGDSARGLALLRQAMSGDGAKPSLRTQYAGVLLQVGLDAELVPLLRELENDPQLSYPERKAVEELSFGYAVRQADRAREKGDLAGAYERLAPYLRQNPPHPKALIMLGHLYREAGEPRKALDLYLEILAQQPKEMDARRAAFAAAIELGELRQAESLVTAGLKYFPDSPQANALAGQLARIRGRDGEAIQYFERALELLGSSHHAPLPEMWSRSSTDGNPFASIATGPSTKMGVTDGPAAPPGRRSAHALSRADLKAFEVGQDGRAGTPESSSTAGPRTTPSANLLTANKSYYNPFGQPAGETQHRTSSVGAQAQMRTDEIRESHQLLHDQLLSELNAMRAARGAQAATGLSIRARDGEEGLGELHDLQIPLEAEMSPQGDWGRLSLRVVPVSLRAGDLNPGDVDKIQRFGTNALAVDQSGSGRIAQEDQGVGIAAQWQYRDWSVDLGSSGLGFAVENVIGGLRWQPSLGRFRFGLAASRRSVTDSLLSYAGTEDNVSGVTWGGVVSTGGRFDMAYDEGQYGLYGSAAYASLDGERVASNTKLRLGGGLFWRAYEDADQRVTAGVDITYFGYDENLSHFTLGQGGYFSPQHYTSFGVPVTWSGRHGRVAFGLTGYLGLQTFQEDDSPVFPNDRELQDRLEALAQSTPGVRTFFPGQSKTGISYNFSADLSFQIQPKLAVGGVVSFDNARDFNEQGGMVYVRYFFQPQPLPVAFPPRSVRPRYGETP
ncbi:MAG: cellulose synthase subunit BcsC-related outer membrane protein, partial [Gammaproteobacteria bacterium]